MTTLATDRLAERVRALSELAPLGELAAGGAAPLPDTYLVGGTVRDLLVGRTPVDIDLAIDGDRTAIAAALGASSDETRFGTIRILRDGVRYDIARTRRERYPHPGALPEVEPAPIEEDLLRRDFTVNAIAFGLSGPRVGKIASAPGALDDLAHRRLAVLHDASFTDDPTRLLRLARYAARLEFELTPHTRRLAERAISSGALQTISGTRIGNELRLLATEQDPINAFTTVSGLGLPWSIDANIAKAALAALPADGRPDLLILALALAPAALDHLGFVAADRDAIIEAATQAPLLAARLYGARSNSEIAAAVGSAGAETVALASALGPPEPAQRWLTELRHVRLEITGADLLAAGVPEGPGLGRGLAAARAARLDGRAPDRAAQLEVALRAAR